MLTLLTERGTRRQKVKESRIVLWDISRQVSRRQRGAPVEKREPRWGRTRHLNHSKIQKTSKICTEQQRKSTGQMHDSKQVEAACKETAG